MYQDALLDQMGRPRGMQPREQGGIMGNRITNATFRDEGPTSDPYAYDDSIRNATNKYFQDNYGRAGTDAEHASRAGLLDQQRKQSMGAPPLSGGMEHLGGGPDWRNPGGVAAPAPTAPQGLGNFAGKLEGFGGMLDDGRSKLDAGDSPKYQFGRAMSQFDPKGGISQELLDALNALGLGNVTGGIGGDKISIGNADPRFEGVTEFDIIRDLEGGGGWQWGGLNGKAAQSQGAPGLGGNRPGMGGGVQTLMQDPSSAIAAALAQSRTPNIEALLAQLAGQ